MTDETAPTPTAVRVSVVMPVRNEGRNVIKTLESLMLQTRLPDEIVVADGCSTDDTVEQILAFKDGGVPIRVVRNERMLRGPALNLGTREARYDVIAPMDFGNIAEPTWLAELMRPFEADPAVDLVGGLHEPIMATRFERVSAAIIYYEDCMLPEFDLAKLESVLQPNFVPGGMNMAYRRRAWQRAGGFCEWARRGQDRLFGLRVRNTGGKVRMAFAARMRHEMAQSFGEVFQRHYHYGIWTAREGLPRRRFAKLSRVYAAGLAALALAPMFPWLLLLLAVGASGYIYVGAWRKLPQVARVHGVRYDAPDYLLSVGVLFVRDSAVVSGNMVGSVSRLCDPAWRRRTEAYLIRGEQDETALPAAAAPV